MNWHSALRVQARGRAAELYPRSLVRELAGIVQEGPGFDDETARRRFPKRLWEWAAETLRHAQYPVRPPPKAAGRPLEHFYGTIRKAVHEWVDMRDDLRRWIALHAATPSPLTGDPAADNASLDGATEDALEQISRCLAYLAQAADAAEINHDVRKSIPPRGRERHAVESLAALWTEATDKRPTRTIDKFGGRSGPFVDFVYKAMLPIYPDMGSIDGLIDQITNPAKIKEATDSTERKTSL
jgi:hypothetical protein